jgi:pyrimidine-nucleoside phosphorylase
MVGGLTESEREAKALAVQALRGASSPAWQMFQSLVAAQGGSLDAFWEGILRQRRVEPAFYLSPARGRIVRMDARGIGRAAMVLGAGRATREASIDMDAGIRLYKKCGDTTEEGEPLMALYVSSSANNVQAKISAVRQILDKSIDVIEES